MRAPPESLKPIDRAADLQRIFHQVADLLGVNPAQGAAADGEVLAERGHQPAVHNARCRSPRRRPAGFLFQAEIVAVVVGVHAPFLESAGLEQLVQPVAGGHDALFAPGFQFVFAAAGAGGGAAFLQFVQEVLWV